MPFDFILSSWFLFLIGFGAFMYHLGAYMACLPPYRPTADNDIPSRRWHRFIDWPGNRYDINNNYASVWLIILRAPGMTFMFIGLVIFCFGLFLVTFSPSEVARAWRRGFGV